MAIPAARFAAPASVPADRGPYARLGKRLFDLAIVLPLLPLALVAGVPIALWNALAFRDVRRVFFVQERVGLGGRTFCILKFRTMREPRKGASDSWFNGGDAARVTRFGRLLRNTHLDELPQIINILRGDMHLVGPRPEMPDVHAWAMQEVPGFEARLSVRPGLTGLAQVTQGYTGASAESYARKLAIDTDYISRLSLRLDLEVVLRTVPWMLQGRGWGWNASTAAPECESSNALDLARDDEGQPAPRSLIQRRPGARRDRAKVDAA